MTTPLDDQPDGDEARRLIRECRAAMFSGAVGLNRFELNRKVADAFRDLRLEGIRKITVNVFMEDANESTVVVMMIAPTLLLSDIEISTIDDRRGT